MIRLLGAWRDLYSKITRIQLEKVYSYLYVVQMTLYYSISNLGKMFVGILKHKIDVSNQPILNHDIVFKPSNDSIWFNWSFLHTFNLVLCRKNFRHISAFWVLTSHIILKYKFLLFIKMIRTFLELYWWIPSLTWCDLNDDTMLLGNNV